MLEFKALEEYYKILGVDSGVSDAVLKKAYRKLAMRYHPDLKSGSEAHFKKIVEAYETITAYRKSRERLQSLGPQEREALYQHLKAKAQERAKAKAHERAAKFRADKIKAQNKAYRQAIYSLLGVILTSYFSYQGYYWHLEWQINQEKVQAVAEVIGIERNRVVYQFETDSGTVIDRSYVSGFGLQMFADNGLPLKTGDQFIVNYNGKRPEYHQLNFFQVSSTTFNRYIELAADALARSRMDPLRREGWITNDKARCMALLIYDHDGLPGLAKLYHFDTNPLNKLSQNSLTWFFYQKGETFQWAQKECKLKLD